MAGRIGAFASWKNTHDRAARTLPARRALDAKFEAEVDPDGVLDPTERAVRAKYARQEYFARLSMASAMARRKPRLLRTVPVDVVEPELDEAGGPDEAA